VDTSQRLRRAISFMDERAPANKEMFSGAREAEILMRVDDAAFGAPTKLVFLGFDANSPYLVGHTGVQSAQESALHAPVAEHARVQAASQ
jgi:hypothetical protein